MMLLGRIDRVQVTTDQYPRGADLKGVRVSVPSLINGNPSIEAESCSPPIIDQRIDQLQCHEVGE
jgi:hypothetical protein